MERKGDRMEILKGAGFVSPRKAIKMAIQEGYEEHNLGELLEQKSKNFFVGKKLVLVIFNESKNERKLLDSSCLFNCLVFVDGKRVEWHKAYLPQKVARTCELSGKVVIDDQTLSSKVVRAIKDYLEKELFNSQPCKCYWC